MDLLDETPILDIKPYLPYADCLPQVMCSFGYFSTSITSERQYIHFFFYIIFVIGSFCNFSYFLFIAAEANAGWARDPLVRAPGSFSNYLKKKHSCLVF